MLYLKTIMNFQLFLILRLVVQVPQFNEQEACCFDNSYPKSIKQVFILIKNN